MLMADMSESERQTMRELCAPALPVGVELLETREGVALVWHPDGRAELVALHGLPGVIDGLLSPEGLEHRAAAHERLAGELRRFANIARQELAP